MYRYCYTAPARGSLIPCGLDTASCVTLGGAGRGLASGSSTTEGFCLMAGEMCAQRLAPGTTCVAWPKIHPARASLDPLPGDMWRQLPTIWCLGDTAALWRDGPRSLSESNLSQSARYPDVVFPGDTAMVHHFGQASLVSPPALAFETGAASARSLTQAPVMYAWGDAKPFFDRRPFFDSRPGLRTCLPSVVGKLLRWRETSLVLHSFSPPLGATSRRSWL